MSEADYADDLVLLKNPRTQANSQLQSQEALSSMGMQIKQSLCV